MSLLDKYKERQKKNTKTATQSSDTVGSLLEKYKQRADDPTWFQKGAFENGSDGFWDFLGNLGKTVVGTAHDVNENITEAVVDATENLIDTTAYGVGLVGSLFDKDFKDDVGKFIAKEILAPKQTGEAVATYGNPTGWLNLLVNGGKTEENSVLGDKADGLVQSGSHLAGSYALERLGVPSWLTMGVNAFGSEIESALQQDATFAEAGISGAISAVAEVAFEKLSKGIKFKGATADEGLQHWLKTSIKNKVGRTIAKYATDMVAEGGEEVATEFVSSIGKNFTYMDDKKFNEIFSSEDALDAFIGGAAMSGALGGGKIVNSKRTGRDYTSGLTANEEKVVNKLYEEALSQKGKNGKLTLGEKSEIYDGIVEQMEQGRISTDTIESVLGGDTYKGYQSMVEQESKLNKEIEELESLADNAITVKQRERLTEARKQLEGLDTKTAKSNLFSHVDKLTAKDTKLRESYNERTRRGQAFTADLSQYDEKLRPTIQRAIDNGEINNTRATHAFVEGLAKIEAEKGIGFDFTNNSKLAELGLTVAGRNVGGYVDGTNVTLNLNSAEALNKVVGHEVTHVFEGSGQYDALMTAMKEFAAENGIDWDARVQEMQERYKNVKNADPEKELLADLVGEYLFTDSGFVKSLSTKNPGLFKKIFEEIKYLSKTFAGTKQGAALEKVKKTFAEIYRDADVKNTAPMDGVRYALGDIDFPRKMIDYNDISARRAAENETAVGLIQRGKTTIIKQVDFPLELADVNWGNKTESRNAIKEILKDFLGEDVVFNLGDESAIAYLTAKGIDHTLAGENTADKAIALSAFYDLISNAEYSYSGLQDQHSKTVGHENWDYFVAVAQIEGGGTVPLVFAVRSIDQDVRSQIYSIATKKNLTIPRGDGTQGNPANAHPSYGDSSSSNDIVEQDDQKVNGKFSLSGNGQGPAPAGGYRITGEDIALAPTKEDIARMEQEKNAAATSKTDGVEELGAPTREDIAQQERDKKLKGPLLMKDSLDRELEKLYRLQQLNQIQDNAYFVELFKVNAAYQAAGRDFPEAFKRVVGAYQGDAFNSASAATDTDSTGIPEDVAGVKQKEVEAVLGEKGAYVSKQANALYDEVKGMQKGKRVSNTLSYLLDTLDLSEEHKAESYNSLRTALLNIRDNPNQTVNPNSAVEAATREMLGREYDSMAEDFANAGGVAKKVFSIMEDLRADIASLNEERDETIANWDDKIAQAQKDLDNSVLPTQTELKNLEKDRREAMAGFNQKIAEKQAMLEGKRNTDTKAANNLKMQIERLTRLRDSTDAEYAKRIGHAEQRAQAAALESNKIKAKIEKYERRKAKTEARYAERIRQQEERLERMSKPGYWTAMQRKAKMEEYTNLMAELVGDTSTWVDKKLGLSYSINTLRRNLRDIVRDSKGNRDIAKADAIYEELQGKYNHNEAELKRESMRIKEKFKKLNHAEDTYAHMLGEFQYNPDSKLSQEKLEEYYEKHKDKIDTKKVDEAIAEARKVFDDLIVRVNERLKEQGMRQIPYRKGYFPHFTNPKQTWLHKFFNWKPVDNEIPTSIAGLTEEFNPQRSWQSFDKQRTSDDTDYSLEQGLDSYIHGALDWIYHIEDIQKRRALENHIRYVHSDEGIKKRIEEIRNNESYDADEAQELIDAVYAEAKNPLNNFVSDLRTGTNTLANKKSSLDRKAEEMTNRKIYSVMTNLNSRINANMVVGSFSSALTNFIPITQSWLEVSPLYSLKGMRDTIKSTFRDDDGMVNKSDFLTNRLMNEEKLYQTGWDKVSEKAGIMMEAIDSFTSQTVWRSKYLQNMAEGMSETEAIKNADQFAENVIAGRSRGNQPTIFDAKNPITKIFTAFQLEVANQYGYMFKDAPQDSKNKGRLIKGYATAFLGAYAYNALYSSLVGRDAAFDPISILEDLFRDLFGDDEEEPEEAILNLADNVLEEVPFIGGLMGGGRVPISSAIPYEGDYKTFITDIANGELSAKEMLKPIYYLAMPVAGGQLKKTNEGLKMFDEDLPVAGSYTESGNLRFPVEEDSIADWLKAALFGQYASKNAREYFDNGWAPLEEKQIEEFAALDVPIADYREIRKQLGKLGTTGEKLAYIHTLDLPISKKNILANNLTDRKTPIDMADWGKLEEFDYAVKYPEKAQFLVANGISVKEYNNFDDETKDAYDWAYLNPEKYAVSKTVSNDIVTYRKYTQELSEIKADKDSKGKTVSGSRKKKVVQYINGLDMDYGAKLVLYKMEYPSDDTYNGKIIQYVNDIEGFTFEQKATVLKELGFTVTSDGKVAWN